MTMATNEIPDSAACYFSLAEEADKEDMPPVRDCSCRGDSAGFAHLSCLAKYAEQKCKGAYDGDIQSFIEPWETCNNCNQPFQNQLAVELASALVLFAEATYGHAGNNKWDKLKVMTAIKSKIKVMMSTDKEIVKVETKILINKLLSMIDEAKKDLNMSRWVHMPQDSVEYQYYKLVCGQYEAYTYSKLEVMLMMDYSE